jgi:drug/metabolite transporter (DMT)-like permease
LTPPPSSLRGIASMLACAAFFVANDSCMKLVMAHAPPYQVLFMRGAFGSLFCLPLLLALGYRRRIALALDRWVLIRAMAETFAILCFILALAHMPLGDITAIFQLAPLLVVAGASLIWGEKVGAVRMLLIAVGVAGALLVAQPGAATASPYALLGLVTAAGAAGRDLASRKVPPDIPGLVVAFATILVVMAAAAISSLVSEAQVAPSGRDLLLSAAAGALLIGGHFFIYMAFRLAAARTLAPFYYAFTAWAVFFGLVIFGDWPNRLALLGIALIVASGVAVILIHPPHKAEP